jgi:hypothetical protein
MHHCDDQHGVGQALQGALKKESEESQMFHSEYRPVAFGTKVRATPVRTDGEAQGR